MIIIILVNYVVLTVLMVVVWGEISPRSITVTTRSGNSDTALIFFLISALRWGGWSTPLPGRFNLGEESQHSLYRRLGGPQGWCERMWRISPPPGFDSQTVQPLASRCTG